MKHGQERDPSELARFAHTLRQARTQANLTQGDMARGAGISEAMYWRYEAAQGWPSLATLARLSGILGCSVDALLGLATLDPARLNKPAESSEMRRVRHELRKARPETLALVERVLDTLDKARNG